MHVPFAVGLRQALGAAAVPHARWLATGIAAALVAAFWGRVALARWDRPIHTWRMLLEELYFAHWFAALFGALLFLVGSAVLLPIRWFGNASLTFAQLALVAYLVGLVVSV